MAECGTYIGKGTVNYPCTLEAPHEGPHMANELPRTVQERKNWEAQQREAKAARSHSESGLGKFQGRAETTAQRYTENPTEHPSVVKQREEDRLAALRAAQENLRRGADAAVTAICPQCKLGRHSMCDFVKDNEGAMHADEFINCFCKCYKRNPDAHAPSASNVNGVPCTVCKGEGEIASGTGVFATMSKPCPRCDGTGVEPEPKWTEEQIQSLRDNGAFGYMEPTEAEKATPLKSEEEMFEIADALAVPTKQRPGDQPLPVVNDSPFIQELVIADIEARKQVGIQRYGTALQANNGRDALVDAYEEAMDLAMYLKQLIVEREQ